MIVFAFDTETSDIPASRLLPLNKQPEIIEFYGCSADLETGEILFDIDLMIKPSKELDETSKASKAHKITNDMLKDAPSFSDVADQIQTAFDKGGKPLAHNASFDIEMVEIEFQRLGREFLHPLKAICTVEATMHLRGYRLSLMALHEMLFARPFPEAHRAKNDVRALVDCAVELYRRGEL